MGASQGGGGGLASLLVAPPKVVSASEQATAIRMAAEKDATNRFKTYLDAQRARVTDAGTFGYLSGGASKSLGGL